MHVSRTDNDLQFAVCAEPGCTELVALDGAGSTGQCARHRRLARNRAGVCPNCGGARERLPVINDLTGRQLRRQGVPVWFSRCTVCGYEQRGRQ